MDKLKQLEEALRKVIREEANKLICESHPEVCALRDEDMKALESKVLMLVGANGGMSVQEAIARLESELGMIG